jgi:hypothetical protein
MGGEFNNIFDCFGDFGPDSEEEGTDDGDNEKVTE